MEYLTLQTFKEKVFDFETSENWKLQSDKPCIIDFYADWCGPCKTISPILEELQIEYEGKIQIYKVNVDDEYQLSSIFGVRSIPTLLFCGIDKKPELITGAIPKSKFIQIIEEMIK